LNYLYIYVSILYTYIHIYHTFKYNTYLLESETSAVFMCCNKCRINVAQYFYLLKNSMKAPKVIKYNILNNQKTNPINST